MGDTLEKRLYLRLIELSKSYPKHINFTLFPYQEKPENEFEE